MVSCTQGIGTLRLFFPGCSFIHVSMGLRAKTQNAEPQVQHRVGFYIIFALLSPIYGSIQSECVVYVTEP